MALLDRSHVEASIMEAADPLALSHASRLPSYMVMSSNMKGNLTIASPSVAVVPVVRMSVDEITFQPRHAAHDH